MTVKMPTSLSSGSIVVDKSLLEHLLPALKASPVRSGPGSWKCLLPLFGHVIHNWACTNKTHSVTIAHTVPLVQVSSQCPEGGERARRFCLSNEITSHSGPVHQKTQRDQCRTAGLQRVAAWSRRHRWAGLLRKTVEIHPQWSFSVAVIGYFSLIPVTEANGSMFDLKILFTMFQYTAELQDLKY